MIYVHFSSSLSSKLTLVINNDYICHYKPLFSCFYHGAIEDCCINSRKNDWFGHKSQMCGLVQAKFLIVLIAIVESNFEITRINFSLFLCQMLKWGKLYGFWVAPCGMIIQVESCHIWHVALVCFSMVLTFVVFYIWVSVTIETNFVYFGDFHDLEFVVGLEPFKGWTSSMKACVT